MYWKLLQFFFVCLVLEIAVLVLGQIIRFAWEPLFLAISGLLFLAVAAIALLSYIRATYGDWENLIDLGAIETESVDIPVADGWSLAAKVLKPRSIGEDQKLPVVIVHHGLGKSWKRMLVYAVPIAMDGYLVVLPDARAHGESAKRFKKARKDDWYIDEQTGIIPDGHRIVDYAYGRPDADPSRVAMTGHSLGGVVSLTAGLVDPRVKIVIPISAFYSFTENINAPKARRPFTEEWFNVNALRFTINYGKLSRLDEHFSPKHFITLLDPAEGRQKVRIVHALDDKLVNASMSAECIIKAFDLPPEHVLLTKKGDHSLRGQETIVTSKLLAWLREEFSR
jgi:pimeloyl-ACP methyl ester carboxylesterase